MVVVVIEDNDAQRQMLCEKVRRWFAQAACALSLFSYADATCFCAKTLRPDLALLDIELGEANGLDIARQLRQERPECQIAFVTSYTEYVGACYEVEHLWFIPKMNLDVYLPRALEKAVQQYRAIQGYVLRLGQGAGAVLIKQADIFYLERQLHTTFVYGEKGIIGKTTHKLSQLDLQLNTGCFGSPHNSYRVHLEYIKRVEKSKLYLENEVILPISRACQKALLHAVARYAAQREHSFSKFVMEEGVTTFPI